MSRKHNKSGLTTLSILRYSDAQILEELEVSLKEKIQPRGELIENSRCKVWPCKKSKITLQGKVLVQCFGKGGNTCLIFYQDAGEAYHVAAFRLFGRERLSRVQPNKDRDSLVVSHICGTRNCCKKNHLLLEPKWVNDERTHCHFLPHSMIKRGFPALKTVRWVRKVCPHSPRCFTYLGAHDPDERVITNPVVV
jgi:hypothetical protein